MTYEQVNALADLVSIRLRAAVDAECRVGAYFTRSPQAVIGVLGAMKAGVTFMPLRHDQSLPIEPAFGAIVTEERLLDRAIALQLPHVCVPDRMPVDGVSGSATQRAPAHVHAEQCACALPADGAVHDWRDFRHVDIVGAVERARDALDIDSNTTVLGHASVDDPVFLLEAFLPLSVGGSLQLIDGPLFAGRARSEQQRTVLFTDPRVVEELLNDSTLPRNVHVLVLRGDTISATLLERLTKTAPAMAAYGALGQLETCGWTTGRRIEPGLENRYSRQCPGGVTLHVLDRDLREKPANEEGEVYVSGPSIARPLDPADPPSKRPIVSTGFAGYYEAAGRIRITVSRRRPAVDERAGIDEVRPQTATNADYDRAEVAHTATQRSLVSIWKTVLARDHIGLDENFFGLGANSLAAALACAEISKEFGIKLSIVHIYSHPNITDLAGAIDAFQVVPAVGGAP